MKISTNYMRVLQSLGLALLVFGGVLFASHNHFRSSAAKVTAPRITPTVRPLAAHPAQAQQATAEQLLRQATSAPPVADLLAKAQTDGTVRVIVGLRASFQPEGTLENLAVVQTQRLSIAQAQDSLLSRMTAFNVIGIKQFAYIPFLAMEVDAAGLQYLQSAPEVVSIQEDVLHTLSLAESVPLIGAPAAWAAGFTGAGQTVAILDTGVDKTHPFLTGKVVSEACFSTTSSGVTSTCPGGVAESTEVGSGVNCDFGGCDHGTHVAGIAAGKSATFSGVARDANLIAIKVASRRNDCSSGDCVGLSDKDILGGLQRVYELRSTFNIAAVNLSLGGGKFTANCDASQAMYKMAIDNLRSVGIATIVASGNDGYTGSLHTPACLSSAISVGSTGDGSSNGSSTAALDVVSSFSNSSSFLHLLAPGQWIRSSVPGGGFDNKAGTSMAAPHVAGAWAVLKSKSPNASVAQILMALKDTGLPITDARNGITKPRIRVDAAAMALSTTACDYAIAPTTQSFPVSGGTGTVTVTAASGCAWTASSNVPWLTITAGSSGTSNGSVSFTAAANPGMERTGTLLVAGQSFTVTQASVPALAVDDGTDEDSGRLQLSGTLYGVNRLTPTSYPATINAVAIYFSSGVGVNLGDSLTVLAGANPSGSASLSGISLQPTTAIVQGLDRFSVYSIPSLTINSGDFVVGMRFTHSPNVFPLALDFTPPLQGRSYTSVNGTTFTLTGANLLGANLMMRALLAPASPNCPTITGISPTSGAVGSQVTITGVNLTGVTAVQFANNVAAPFTVNSDSSITTTVPSGAVTGPLTISKTGCPDVQTAVFTVTPPSTSCLTISGLTPTSGAVGSTLTITGANFTGVSAVRFANNVAAQFTVNSDTSITATVPSGAVTGPITISKTGCSDVQTAVFTVTSPPPSCPMVSGLTPTSGVVDSAVTITGENFAGVTAVRFSNNVSATFTVNSSGTQISTTVPSGAVTGTLTISKPGCPDVQTGVFTVVMPPNPVPVLTSLNPSSAAAGGSAFTLTVTGTNFVTGSVVRWNNSDRTTSLVSATQLTAAISASDIATPGNASVTVFNPAPGGGVSGVLTFTILPSNLQCDTALCFADAGTWCNRLSFEGRYLNHRVVVPGVNLNQPLAVFTGGRINPLISQYLGCGGYSRSDLRSTLIAAYLAAQLDIQTQLSFWWINLGKQTLGCHVITPMSMPGMPGAPRALPATLSGGPITSLTDASSLQDLYDATDWVVTKGSMDDLQKLIAIYKQLNTCRRD